MILKKTNIRFAAKHNKTILNLMWGSVVSWLALSTTDQVLKVRALASNILLCSLARDCNLKVPLSI